MRVLDPKIKNPIYKLHDRASQAIGDGGVVGGFAVGGIAAPVAAGVMIDSPFAMLSTIGFYGLITFRNYLKNTKSKTRVSELVKIKDAIPSEYHYVINPMIEEVYHCPNVHYDCKVGERGVMNVYDVKSNNAGRITSYSARRTYLDRETQAQWAKREAQEKILEAGYGCKFCGERIATARDLREECKVRHDENNASVQNALVVLESKREANKAMAELSQIMSTVQKELM